MSPLIPRTLVALLCACALRPDAAEAQSLRGSRSSVERMYRQAMDHDLHFFETATGVRRAANGGSLVRLSGNGDFRLAGVSHAYVLPATRTFVQRLGAQYRDVCREPMVVTSLVRPKSLRLANSTAKSVHPTGMAVDLRKPRAGRCLTWLRRTLLSLEGQGVIEATEEHRPPHFHIAVFPSPYTRHVTSSGGRVAAAEPKRTPARTASKAKASAPTNAGADGSSYRVRRGDSIWSIARRTRVTVDEIKVANNLRSSRIEAGQLLTIPSSR